MGFEFFQQRWASAETGNCGLHLESHRGTGASESLIAEQNERASLAGGETSESKPRGWGDRVPAFLGAPLRDAALGRRCGEIHDDQREALGLEQTLATAQAGAKIGCPDPEHALERDPHRLGRRGVEGIGAIHDGHVCTPPSRLTEQGQHQGGATRGRGATDLAQGARRETAVQKLIDILQAARMSAGIRIGAWPVSPVNLGT